MAQADPSPARPPAPLPSLPIDWQGEPYRLFFPLAVAIGMFGVAPWLLYGACAQWGSGSGALATCPSVASYYPAGLHAVAQMQACLPAFAAGFLLTAVPKRTRTPSVSWPEIWLVFAAILTIPIAEVLGSPIAAQGAYLAALLLIVQAAVRRFLARGAARKPPASFLMVPIGLLGGAVGASLRIASLLGVGPDWLSPLGRLLSLEGLLTCLVLGVGSFFFGLALRGEPPPDLKPGDGPRAALYLGAGLLLMAGLVAQEAVSVRLGLALRAVVAIGVWITAKAHLPPKRPGMNRKVVWASAWALPLGLTLAAAFPDDRIAWMHIVFVGGFGLLAFAVSAHVTLGHAGDEARRDGRPWPVAVFVALFASAAVLRAVATHMASVYFGWLAIAASIWLLGAIAWALFLLPRMWRPPTGTAAA